MQIESGSVDTSILMVNNGKYSNDGCLVNPFATLNDGLVDLTWVRDPAYFGMFGYKELMNDARTGGIQAYKKHSIYMRGRKIKCTFIEPEVEAQPMPADAEEQKEPKDPQEETKEPPAEPEVPDKTVGIDDADLPYKKSVTWQCFPQNIEIMLDTNWYFVENGAFPETYDRDEEEEKFLVDQIVDDIWEKYDADKSGDLDEGEVKSMLMDICKAQGRPFN